MFSRVIRSSEHLVFIVHTLITKLQHHHRRIASSPGSSKFFSVRRWKDGKIWEVKSSAADCIIGLCTKVHEPLKQSNLTLFAYYEMGVSDHRVYTDDDKGAVPTKWECLGLSNPNPPNNPKVWLFTNSAWLDLTLPNKYCITANAGTNGGTKIKLQDQS